MLQPYIKKWFINGLGLLLIPLLGFSSEQSLTILYSSNDMGYVEPCG
jgi:hypothetical protein